MITQSRLKELLHYDPKTGSFTKKNNKNGCVDKSTGYLRISINSKLYYAHRLAFLLMDGKIPENVDHENHVKTDNRWVNLRGCTHQENMKNILLRNDNTSGTVGVCFNKFKKRWTSRIYVNCHQTSLGVFKNKEDAIQARKEANIKYNFHPNHGRKL